MLKNPVNVINEEESNFSYDNSKTNTLTNTNGEKTDRMRSLFEKNQKID